MKCTRDTCERSAVARGFCRTHYNLELYHKRLKTATHALPGTGTQTSGGYVRIGSGKAIHIVKAEKALGKPLPKGAQVHHVDEDKTNNDPSNLVVCPDQKYHMLLHRRRDSLLASGSPNNRQCMYCKEWDNPENMYVGKSSAQHRECYNQIKNQRGY